jgi:hypothetical protein
MSSRLDDAIVRRLVNPHDFTLMPTAGGPLLTLGRAPGMALSCQLMHMIPLAT